MTLSERPAQRPSARSLPEGPDVHRRPESVRPPSGPYTAGGKRLLSLVLLLVALPVALPVTLAVALANLVVFRDPRCVLFRQPRIGRDGHVFRIWKFRTMRSGAPEHAVPDDARRDFHSWRTGEDDLRVTAFGRWLRSTHLDELPQLINVLRGDMDLVGPRPEMVEIHEWAGRVVPGFDARGALRPGITGLAQVTQGYAGMDAEAYRLKLEADLEYIESVSLGLDLAILARTVLWVLGGRGWRRARVRRTMAGSVDPLTGTMTPWPRSVSSPTPSRSSTTREPGIPSAPGD